MENVFIYALSDPRNNQIRYVGKANNPDDRYTNHFNSARDKNTHKRNWINSVRKDGLRPELIIIDEVPKSEWVYWEKFYISLFKTWGFSLVNYTEGGDGSTFGNSGSWKKGNTPHNKGVACSEETKQKIRNKLTGVSNVSSYKPIIQYDLQFNEVRRYKCVKDAIEESGGFFLASKISLCCKLKNIKHKGFIWRYDNGENLTKVNKKKRKGRGVYQYDINFNLLKYYSSLKEASDSLNIKLSNISFCCKNENRKAGGFFWRYKQITK